MRERPSCPIVWGPPAAQPEGSEMMIRLRTQTLFLLALAALVACGAPVKEQQPETPFPVDEFGPVEPAPPPAPSPWTKSFQSSALLIADEIRIEGPKGLLDHIATRIEPEFHTYEATTLPEGFQQLFKPRTEAAGIDIRAYFDALEVVAFQRLVLLERPGDVDVIVQAVGDAFYREASTGREQRGSSLRFVGERPE